MALAHRPPLLLLDEPTDGLDPVMRDQTIRALIDHLSEARTTLLLSTHHVGEVERLADHLGVLSNGELRAQIPLQALHSGLRRYRAEIPVGWTGNSAWSCNILKRADTDTTLDWIVWGPEANVVEVLTRSGAAIHSVIPLTLEEATLAFLSVPAGGP
jgi:ABC-2 type transport system ATP-binding protein